MKARDIMTDGILVVPADYSISDTINFFAEEKITGAPVVSATGKVIGVVTLSDIIKQKNEEAEIDYSFMEYYNEFVGQEISEDRYHSLVNTQHEYQPVTDIMTPTIFQVDIDEHYREVARQMVGKQIHRVFVSENDKLVGIVSSMDILRALC